MDLFSLKNKFLTSLILGVYLFISIYALVSLTNQMSMHSEHSPCPYMLGEQGICSMNTFDHISAWQQLSQVFFTLFKIIIPSVCVLLYLFLFSEILKSLRLYSPPLRSSLYQFLFARGILNPKAP